MGRREAWALAALLLVASSCDRAPARQELVIPHGYLARLEVKEGGIVHGFGPFVGYYFRPEAGHDLGRLRFVCFNERGFYASDAPVNARLFEGEAVLARLPPTGAIPQDPEARIQPVFFAEAPEAWLATRPEPREEFVHFHSCYDALGPSRVGYWLRHRAAAEFTYDMGGRVGPTSPLFHRVTPGPDRGFARIVEFDRGLPGIRPVEALGVSRSLRPVPHEELRSMNDFSSLEPLQGAARVGRRRLTWKDELVLASLPTVTILAVLLFLEAFARQRLLFSSLASSAFLIYLDPEHGANAVRTLVLAHLLAALAGFAGYLALGPGYLSGGAAMVATIVGVILLDAVHPPAVATSLGFAFRGADATNLALFLFALFLVAILVSLERATLWLLARLRRGRS